MDGPVLGAIQQVRSVDWAAVVAVHAALNGLVALSQNEEDGTCTG